MHKTKFTCYYVKGDNYTEEMEHIPFGEEVDENGNKGDPFKRVRWYYPELSGRDAEAILRLHQIEGSFLLRSRMVMSSKKGAPVSQNEYSLNVWFEKRPSQYKVEYRCEDGSIKFGLKKYGSVREFDSKMRRGYLINNGSHDIILKTPIPNISEPSITKEKVFDIEIAKLSRCPDIIYSGHDANYTNISAIHLRKVNNEMHSGYLTKQGHLVKSWKKRWFTLRQNNLSYYKNNNQDQSAINTINLDTIDEIIENDHYYKKEYCFTIVGKGGYKLTMEAENEAEYKRWIEKLSRIIKSNKIS